MNIKKRFREDAIVNGLFVGVTGFSTTVILNELLHSISMAENHTGIGGVVISLLWGAALFLQIAGSIKLKLKNSDVDE